jgi:hypothetical protein
VQNCLIVRFVLPIHSTSVTRELTYAGDPPGWLVSFK